MNVLEETMLKMIQDYPYYANLIMQMDKKLTKDVPIAAVSVTSRINLYINPEAFGSLPMSIRVGVLLHECYHILHDHIGRSKSVAKQFNKALNIAADRAINEHLHTISKNGKLTATIPDKARFKKDGKWQEMQPVTKHNFQTTYAGKTIKDNETMEYYYKFLKQNAKKGEGGESDFGGDMDTIDDHGTWEEGDGSPEEIKEIVKGAINKAAEKTAAGNIPGDVQSIINDLNKSVVSWQAVLQRFVAKCVNTNVDSSRKRRNKRYGIVHPGTIKEPVLRLGVAIDTSGSVHDKYLNQFFSEIKKIHALGIEIFCVEADTTVTQAFEYDPKKPIVAKGRGGTAFQPAITYLEAEAECDAILYFTDGENYHEELKIKKPILWCLCPSYTIPKTQSEKQCIKITLPEDKKS
jgi:predicted metal-dependent peptidase